MARYVLSPQALVSLQQISTYTLQNFGRRQQKAYLANLRQTMRALARNPGLGRDRSEIKHGDFSMPTGKHNIYYRVLDSHIEVIDVLHLSMEPQRYL